MLLVLEQLLHLVGAWSESFRVRPSLSFGLHKPMLRPGSSLAQQHERVSEASALQLVLQTISHRSRHCLVLHLSARQELHSSISTRVKCGANWPGLLCLAPLHIFRATPHTSLLPAVTHVLQFMWNADWSPGQYGKCRLSRQGDTPLASRLSI